MSESALIARNEGGIFEELHFYSICATLGKVRSIAVYQHILYKVAPNIEQVQLTENSHKENMKKLKSAAINNCGDLSTNGVQFSRLFIYHLLL